MWKGEVAAIHRRFMLKVYRTAERTQWVDSGHCLAHRVYLKKLIASPPTKSRLGGPFRVNLTFTGDP